MGNEQLRAAEHALAVIFMWTFGLIAVGFVLLGEWYLALLNTVIAMTHHRLARALSGRAK
jgi:hypothetical protein